MFLGGIGARNQWSYIEIRSYPSAKRFRILTGKPPYAPCTLLVLICRAGKLRQRVSRLPKRRHSSAHCDDDVAKHLGPLVRVRNDRAARRSLLLTDQRRAL